MQFNKYTGSSVKAKELTSAVAYYIAKDMKPLYTVEGKGFAKMINKFDPHYTLPSRERLRTSIIPRMYEDLRANTVAPLVEECKFYALTADLWTARNLCQYLEWHFNGITAEWELK